MPKNASLLLGKFPRFRLSVYPGERSRFKFIRQLNIKGLRTTCRRTKQESSGAISEVGASESVMKFERCKMLLIIKAVFHTRLCRSEHCPSACSQGTQQQ